MKILLVYVPSKAHVPALSYDEFSYIYKEINAGFHPLRTLF